MTGVRVKTILKLLLAIIMVVQPVSFSYAMASMTLSHHAITPVSSHNEQHPMNDVMLVSDEQSTHKGGGESGKCCQSTVCSPASVASVATVGCKSKSQRIMSVVITLKSIDLPTEIKPPRNLSA